MFTDIQHIGYLIDDLDVGIAWFAKAFGAINAGGTKMQNSPMVPSGGRNAFVRFGDAEVELMEPADKSGLPKNTLVMHHVGWVVDDIEASAAEARARGLTFLADAPYTNPMQQQVHYFDPASTNGVWMHLTQVPPKPATSPKAPWIADIVHPGYLVRDLDKAVAWYIAKLGGRLVGGGPSRRGGRIAFVNCGAAQVELIEPENAASLADAHILDHVGYESKTLDADLALYSARGLAYQTPEPAVNPVGQRLIYLDTATSLGARMHLTELPG
jgi:catechol 2,3-dioxygenase-like lactoylglutathione lyase family enzyme